MPHRLYGFTIERVRLPLYFSKRNTLQVRLPLQNTQRIRGLDAGNLPSVTGKYNSGSLIFAEVKQALHLPARNHTCFINNQDPAAQRPLWLLTLQKSRDGHRISEADLFQFVHGTPGRSHRQNLVSGFSETTVNFTERSSLASTGSPPNVDRQITRAEHCLDSVPLFGTQLVRRLKVTAFAEAVVAVCPSVNYPDHVALALEGRVCRNFIPGRDENPFRTFKGERALKVTEFDV